MADSQETRAANSKAIVDKTAAKAESEGKLMETKEALSGAAEDVRLSAATITDLHASCDFIMQNYDMRKEHVPTRLTPSRTPRLSCRVPKCEHVMSALTFDSLIPRITNAFQTRSTAK